PCRPNRHTLDQSERVNIKGDLWVIDSPQGLNDVLFNQLLVDHDDRLRYSVVTGSVLPARAAWTVCHGNVAHLMRLGNSRTPAKTASLSSRPATSPSDPFSVSMVRNRPNVSSAADTVLPLRAAVIIDAEALEMAQPEP